LPNQIDYPRDAAHNLFRLDLRSLFDEIILELEKFLAKDGATSIAEGAAEKSCEISTDQRI
jgi:hypothetical protein